MTYALRPGRHRAALILLVLGLAGVAPHAAPQPPQPPVVELVQQLARRVRRGRRRTRSEDYAACEEPRGAEPRPVWDVLSRVRHGLAETVRRLLPFIDIRPRECAVRAPEVAPR